MGIYDDLSKLDQPTPAPPSITPSPEVTPPAHPPRTSISRPRKSPPLTPIVTDVITDVVTSLLEEVDIAGWRELITDTETHNSALRLSASERDSVEDLVRDLKRKERIKTSMNELARLGLLLLVDDFRRRGAKSIIHRIKKPELSAVTPSWRHDDT